LWMVIQESGCRHSVLAKRKDGEVARQSRTPSKARGQQQRAWWSLRAPGVWLTTLSTVVAVATGMFTLRDQIFAQQEYGAPVSDALYERTGW